MSTQFQIGNKVNHDGKQAEIIAIINTQDQFAQRGIADPLLNKLGFDEQSDIDKYKKDATQFPMIIIKYITKHVLNIERMNEWIDINKLRAELNKWRLSDIKHPARDTANPMVQLRQFIDERNERNKPNDMLIIPSAEFYDIVPITPYEKEKLDFETADKLVLSGGRSRKRRHQSRIKKTRSRSRSRSRK